MAVRQGVNRERMPRVRGFFGVALLGVALAVLGSPGSGSARVQPSVAHAPTELSCALPCAVSVRTIGSGRVTSEPALIDCGTSCLALMEPGERLTLVAEARPGETFQRWTHCPRETDGGRCLVDVSGSICVEATFTGAGAAPGDGCPTAGEPQPQEPLDHPPLGTPCTIRGSPGRDLIRGTPGIDVICGGRGDDRLYGLGGHDLVLGGPGHDRLYGGPGREHLLGGPGNDVLTGGPSDDELFGDAGNDAFFARDSFPDFANGGRGRDRARIDRGDALLSVERRF